LRSWAEGREYALARALKKSPHVESLTVFPGSDAIACFADCVALDWKSPAFLEKLRELETHLIVIGPEAPLVDGLADRLRGEGFRVVGPDRALAKLEGSKAYAKQWMKRHGVPTAQSQTLTSRPQAETFVRAWDFSRKLVLKADGLAGGKGVVIAQSLSEAEQAMALLDHHTSIVAEEFIAGREVSVHVLVSDNHFQVCPPVQDHKRRFDGNTGPNTGGMGTVSPPRWWTKAIEENIYERVIMPSVLGIQTEVKQTGALFRGVLFIGVMVDDAGMPFVLEYNTRFGDPETQTLCRRAQGDWLDVFLPLAEGWVLPDVTSFFSRSAACTVIAVTQMYPDKTGERTERLITGLDENGQLLDRGGDWITHGATRKRGGQWFADEGRVLGVGGEGANLDDALEHAYERVRQLHFNDLDYRRDLGSV
jgi:phosphoribosylamine--glycine ligase